MFVITHALAPLIVAATVDAIGIEAGKERRFRAPQLTAIAAAGGLPDILDPHISLAARFSSWTHTAWFFLLAIPVALWIARVLFEESRFLMATCLTSAVALHLACDLVSGGIAWCYPLSPRVIGAYLVPPSSWLWLDGLSIVAATAVVAWLHFREMALSQRNTFQPSP